jgi:AraC family transcriptional activator of pobA
LNQLFRIFRLTEAEAEKIRMEPDDPHLHDYEELIVGVEGKLRHFIDFQSTNLQAPFISFVTRGKVHQAIPESDAGLCYLWVIRFKSEFIPETTFQLYSRYHESANISLVPGLAFKRLVGICEMMAGEMQQDTPDLSVVRHLLAALFTMIESERRKAEPGHQLSAQQTTFRQFLAILEANFRRPEGVEFYAQKLFMSPRNLNLICNQILNQCVSEIIETRKLIEARSLLCSTDRTIAEIGFELGYSDKSYFTAVFKKRAGQTPSEFRQEMRRLIAG